MLAATRTESPEPPEREQVEQRVQREQANFWKSARTPATASVPRPEEPWELLCWITGADTRGKNRSSHTVEPRAVYQQHLENQGSDVARVRGHWKFRAQRLPPRVRKAFQAQQPSARLRSAIRALERYLKMEESEVRPVKSLALWRAGQRRMSQKLGPTTSKPQLNREELDKRLKRLVRVREFNRRRKAILDQEFGRFVRVAKPKPAEGEELSPPERTSKPSRPWLTRSRARQALGPKRRPWLTPEDKALRTSRLRRRYELEGRDPASTSTERHADFHAFVKEELERENRELQQDNELMHRDEQVRKHIAANWLQRQSKSRCPPQTSQSAAQFRKQSPSAC
ncbi:hypothetical protein CYMTET_6745 [Cymbomonas tetramitiformis]|uniref:Uncharacterized protein n=1 Tax=Cymbomonas tetramitiformis TaxID=36881 RepID=A0AAE0GWZ8_9CHLO|nr:hypothetical protein CYMTET_6745 [Cymbomonas tetramitiformis]